MKTEKYTFTHTNNGAGGSIQRAPAVRSKTAEGTDGKRLSFFDNYLYRKRRCISSRHSVCMCFCVSVWGVGFFMQHSSLLRRPRPHIPADLTLSDRTSPSILDFPCSPLVFLFTQPLMLTQSYPPYAAPRHLLLHIALLLLTSLTYPHSSMYVRLL